MFDMSQPNSVTEICGFCGLPLPEGKGKGRKRKVHDKCGQLSRYLTYLTSEIEKLEMSEEAKKKIRKQMFHIANSFTQEKNPPRDKAGRFLKQS